VAQQVADGDCGVGPRVGQAKLREMLANGVVPAELPVVHEGGQQERRERLRTRRQREQRVRGHGLGAVDVSAAVALQDDDLVAADDDECRPGNVPGPEGVGHHPVHVRRGRVSGRRG
jgi:hypothetical protein